MKWQKWNIILTNLYAMNFRYACSNCDLKFVTESSLKGHLDTDHGVIYDGTSIQPLPPDEEIENYVLFFCFLVGCPFLSVQE